MSRVAHSDPPAFVRALVFITASLAIMGTDYVYDSIGPVAELLSRQLGFSDTQIGSLNAVYSLPNILLALVGGILIDRFGARRVLFWASLICLLGAVVTAAGPSYPLIVSGRLLFGVGAETLMVSILVVLAQWFTGRYLALFLALNVSLARFGSYLADRSPSFAHELYARGWQPPLWLAAAAAAVAFFSSTGYWWLDARRARGGAVDAAPTIEHTTLRSALSFRKPYWYVMGLCVTFYSVILPFRSTFAIKYFQQARGLNLEDASRMNSYVFMAAMFLMPLFGLLVDAVGRHGLLMMVGSLLLPLSFVFFGYDTIPLSIPTALLGLSFSLVPAVLWPSVAEYVTADRRGTAYGLMAMLQNTGLTLANLFAGYLNDREGVSALNPAGYASMLWFFGSLGLAGFIFATLLLSSERPA